MTSLKIDLHMHSTVSDGTDTPEQLLDRVQAAGIGLFSVTDHDAIKSSGVLPALLGAEGPRFLSGVEFSCKDTEGKYHILGYGYDPEGAAIRQVVDLGHSYRIRKVQGRLEGLEREFGVTFPAWELSSLFALDNPGKPHLGNLMVKYGFAETKEQAIAQYINRLHFPAEYVRPEEAIRGILASGGIPVLAHPCFGSGDQMIQGREMERRIRRLMEFGLQGLEAFYSGFTPVLRQEILDFARRFDLYVTAGSDYHGTNKPVQLGDTGLEPGPEPPEGLRRFLHDIAGAVKP